jgi:hypothetical protein
MACAATEAKHRNAPIILVGGRGRLSSIQAAELNGHLATATTDFLLNTRFAKYEDYDDIKTNDRNEKTYGKEWRRIE